MKKCYKCNKDLTSTEVIEGILKEEELVIQASKHGWSFKGYVKHGTDNPMKKVTREDDNIHRMYKEARIHQGKHPYSMRFGGLYDVVTVCPKCVTNLYNELEFDLAKTMDDIYNTLKYINVILTGCEFIDKADIDDMITTLGYNIKDIL